MKPSLFIKDTRTKTNKKTSHTTPHAQDEDIDKKRFLLNESTIKFLYFSNIIFNKIVVTLFFNYYTKRP